MTVFKAGGLPPGTDVVSCALGILIERHHCDDMTARAYLVQLAESGNLQPYDAARRLIDDVSASRR